MQLFLTGYAGFGVDPIWIAPLKSWMRSLPELKVLLLNNLGVLSYCWLVAWLCLELSNVISHHNLVFQVQVLVFARREKKNVGWWHSPIQVYRYCICFCSITDTAFYFPHSYATSSWFFRIYGKNKKCKGWISIGTLILVSFCLLRLHLSHFRFFVSVVFSAFVLSPVSSECLFYSVTLQPTLWIPALIFLSILRTISTIL